MCTTYFQYVNVASCVIEFLLTKVLKQPGKMSTFLWHVGGALLHSVRVHQESCNRINYSETYRLVGRGD